MKRRLLATLVIALLAACDLGTGEPDIQFSNALVPLDQESRPSASVETGARSIYGTGVMITPNTCQRLTATVRVSGSSLTVTINALNQRAGCDPGAGAYTYQFAIGDIDPKRYTVRLVYDYSGQKPSETILEEEIIVT